MQYLLDETYSIQFSEDNFSGKYVNIILNDNFAKLCEYLIINPVPPVLLTPFETSLFLRIYMVKEHYRVRWGLKRQSFKRSYGIYRKILLGGYC